MTTTNSHLSRAFGVALFLAVFPGLAGAQDPHAHERQPEGSIFAGTVVEGAPFSADVTVTFAPSSTLTARRATARYYRDSVGRIRAEYLASAESPNQVFLQVSPAEELRRPGFVAPDRVFALDPVTKTYYPLGWPSRTTGMFFTGASQFVFPTGMFTQRDLFTHHWNMLRSTDDRATDVIEELGSREIEGLKVVGQRIVTSLQGGTSEAVHELWESPDLKLLVWSRYSDPNVGEFEFRLTNIRREEPAAARFALPEGYSESSRFPFRGTSVQNRWFTEDMPAARDMKR